MSEKSLTSRFENTADMPMVARGAMGRGRKASRGGVVVGRRRVHRGRWSGGEGVAGSELLIWRWAVKDESSKAAIMCVVKQRGRF